MRRGRRGMFSTDFFFNNTVLKWVLYSVTNYGNPASLLGTLLQ